MLYGRSHQELATHVTLGFHIRKGYVSGHAEGSGGSVVPVRD